LKHIETIGYGGKKPEEFYEELKSMNPDIVVDVRENPYSSYLRMYTKHYLEKRLGLKYTWIKELGNRTREIPPKLVDEETGLRKLHELSEKHNRIVLLCAEKRETDCHREYIKRRFLDLYPYQASP
jgi:uncharacterized protein (DUF488 family)